MLIPVASSRSLAFVENVTTRRVSDVLSVYPGLTGSPSNVRQCYALRGCNVRLMLRPADSVGATDWVPLRWATPLTRSSSGLPCRGKLRPPVTRPTCPLPIQPNGKLLNQTPFILEDDEFRISYTGRTSVAALNEGDDSER